MSPLIYRSAFSLCAFFVLANLSYSVTAQTLLDVNFDQRSVSTLTETDIENDFGELRFTNGVDEGRVEIVRGQQAFGGSGASLKVDFDANGEGPREGGAQWIVEFEEKYEEAFLEYRVKFADGFDFVRGGKLPGLAGGSAPSGSAPADGVRGWTGRLMWRTRFLGVSGQPEQLTCNGISYAKHVHSGFFMDGRQEDDEFWVERDGSDPVMESDVWYKIRQQVRMNTPGQRDGIFRVWLDDRLVLNREDIQFRNIPDLAIDRFFFSTFFGGGDAWRSSKEETIFFDDFKMTIPRERLVPEQYSSVGAAVAAANPGDTVLLGSANWYANVNLDKPLTFGGRGNSRLMGARGDRPVVQVNSDFVTVQNMEIARGSAGVEAFSTAHDLKIQNVELTGNFGDAIRATGCRNVNIENSVLTSNLGRGILLDQVEGFFIFNCRAIDSGGAGFELFSNSGFVANCDAIGNRAGAGFFYIGDNSGFQNNFASENLGMGFLMVSSNSNGFVDNTADNNTRFGLLAYDVNDSFIANNAFRRSGDVGAILDNSRRNSFQDNESSNNSGIGAYFSPTTSSNFAGGNTYQGNAFSLGLIDEGSNLVVD